MTTSELESQLEQAREALSNARRDAAEISADLSANLAAERLVGDLERLCNRLEAELSKQQEFERVTAEESARAEALAEADRAELAHGAALGVCSVAANSVAADLEATLARIEPEAVTVAEAVESYRYAFRRAHGRWPDSFTESLRGQAYLPEGRFLPDGVERSDLYGVAAVAVALATLVRGGDSLQVALGKVTQPALRYDSPTGLELAEDRR